MEAVEESTDVAVEESTTLASAELSGKLKSEGVRYQYSGFGNILVPLGTSFLIGLIFSIVIVMLHIPLTNVVLECIKSRDRQRQRNTSAETKSVDKSKSKDKASKEDEKESSKKESSKNESKNDSKKESKSKNL
ncbi:unnamed protein product [Anisakis simplex]|uniref:Preprotein translocase subunit Sec61beta n=1 Tax=Anisakis simplex TaxID=6269 RepID=A0A0M3JYS7_ANISI|nr:unnamed protein product [Anisakis simplex]